MKRCCRVISRTALVAALAGVAFANAATTANAVPNANVAPVMSRPLRDLQESPDAPPLQRQPMDVRDSTERPSNSHGPQPKGITAGVSFAGIGVSGNDDPNCPQPDTDMAVGDDHVVEVVNLCSGDGVAAFRVWDKDGNVVLPTTSLAGMWGAGSGCDTGNGSGGILFDQLADRWILEQINDAKTGICVAVSQTSDPTGQYALYNFVIDPDGNIDYPRLGLWPDAYYVTTNDWVEDFHVNFTALNRAQMLAGQATQMVVRNGIGHNEGGVDYYVLPASLDGTALPPTGSPGIFLDLTSPYLTGEPSPYALDMWRMVVDWTNPDDSTLTGPTETGVDAINDGVCSLWVMTCIPQPFPGYPLHVHDDHLMSRLPYRNLGDHQALVTNTVVGTGVVPSSPPAGIRWYELNAPAGSTESSDWTVVQQATYLPDDGISRWIGSIAMDHLGNIGLGYSLSGSSLYPSAAYTGHSVGGPSGTMDAGETVFVAGNGVQEDNGELEGYWGRGSAMVVDPADDCTFWTAQEYISETGTYHWSTAIGAFKFDTCVSDVIFTSDFDP